jgi:hypothetical protein
MLLLVHYSTVGVVAERDFRARVPQCLRDGQGCHVCVQAKVCVGAAEAVGRNLWNTRQPADSFHLVQKPRPVVIENPVGTHH